ncbi:Crp/Fnr family transcriptional regulator [Salinicoccus sp. HZC-1]|uniref:Crp/Fnr family transcriptional regulator n=1 Tax=Salinicoccus sp. HZC-1 TaxID=3385497 RepID=UPI00398B0823
MIKTHLSAIKIFESFSDEELDEIAKIAISRKLDKNSHLFRQGEEMAHFYFVIGGNVKVYRVDREGREQIVNFFGPGEMFPHHAIFRTDPYPANASTTVPSEVISIAKNDFEALLKVRPDIAIKMFKYLGSLIVDLQNRLQEKILKPTDVQLLSLLVRLSRSHGEHMDDGRIRISMRLTKQEMASMIGLTRETVSRNLSAFKKLELITENGSGQIIIDIATIDKYLAS